MRLLLLVFMLFGQMGFAQLSPLHTAKIESKFVTENLSPQTALFLEKLSSNKDTLQQHFYEKHGLIQQKETQYINAFLSVETDFNPKELLQEGGKINSISAKVITASLPLDNLEKIAQLTGITHIEIGKKAEALIDKARALTHTDKVHNAVNLPQSFFGKDVIVGIIDSGFDYTHPHFYSADFTKYRILRVWEQENENGTPPNDFSYGTELIGLQEIIEKQHDSVETSHGTHIAGIAAGSGLGTNEDYLGHHTDFTGIAPESELILVSTSRQRPDIADAISYIYEYAESVGKPAVINLSIGGHIGPHDGTSEFDLFIDENVGPGKIFVGAAGNNGQDSIYVQTNHAVDTSQFTAVKFPHDIKNQGETVIDIWGESNMNYEVAVHLYDYSSHQSVDWTDYFTAGTEELHSYTLKDSVTEKESEVQIASGIYPENQKKNTQIYIDNTDQIENIWAIIEVKADSGKVNMWATAEKAELTDLDKGFPFINGSSTSTMVELAGTGKNTISVGAYVSDNEWEPLEHSQGTQSRDYENNTIAPFSSMGKTIDDRIKPDITAPGSMLTSAVNSFGTDYPFDGRKTIAQTQIPPFTWYYGSMQGTSMAAPVVTGIIALWLEANPDLDPVALKEILKNTAMQDEFTGGLPSGGNPTWGYGKIDAHAGLQEVLNNLSSNKIDENSFTIYPNPTEDNIHIHGLISRKNISISLYNINGTQLQSHFYDTVENDEIQLRLNNLSSGIYLLKINSNEQSETYKIIKN